MLRFTLNSGETVDAACPALEQALAATTKTVTSVAILPPKPDELATLIGKRVAVVTFTDPTLVKGTLLEVTPKYLILVHPVTILHRGAVHLVGEL